MQLLKKQLLSIFSSLSVFLLLNSCGDEQLMCGSSQARNLVVKTIADDRNNSLLDYAVKNSKVAEMTTNPVGPKERDANAGRGSQIDGQPPNSSVETEADKSVILERAKEGAVYVLDGTVIVHSRNRATQTVSCSGLLSVTVEDTTAQKQIDFTVEQSPKGEILVSVKPFLF